jgi:hypothetical protein
MVTHTSWLFLADGPLRRRQLQEVDWLALLLAAICHDLEHPGTTNAYQARAVAADAHVKQPLSSRNYLLHARSTRAQRSHCATTTRPSWRTTTAA